MPTSVERSYLTLGIVVGVTLAALYLVRSAGGHDRSNGCRTGRVGQSGLRPDAQLARALVTGLDPDHVYDAARQAIRGFPAELAGQAAGQGSVTRRLAIAGEAGAGDFRPAGLRRRGLHGTAARTSAARERHRCGAR